MLRNIIKRRLTVFLIIFILLILSSGFFLYQKRVVNNQQSDQVLEEINLTFDPEGPYALLYPRRDGNALTLNLKRTASYDQINYELAYNSEGIDRGVMGTISTKEKRGEYDQEILFGTCSKNVCKYDKDVENGTLTLHIKKDKQAFRMITQWHLQKPELDLGVLVAGDGHFTYKINSGTNLSLLKYAIINDLSGAPKLPKDKVVLGKVYALSSLIAKEIPSGVVTVELGEVPPADSVIARFDEGNNKWVEYDTKIDDNKLTANAEKGGVFAIFTSKQ